MVRSKKYRTKHTTKRRRKNKKYKLTKRRRIKKRTKRTKKRIKKRIKKRTKRRIKKRIKRQKGGVCDTKNICSGSNDFTCPSQYNELNKKIIDTHVKKKGIQITHEGKIESLKQTQKKTIEKLKETQQETIEELKQTQQETIEELKQTQQETIEKLKETQQETIDTIDVDLDDIQYKISKLNYGPKQRIINQIQTLEREYKTLDEEEIEEKLNDALKYCGPNCNFFKICKSEKEMDDKEKNIFKEIKTNVINRIDEQIKLEKENAIEESRISLDEHKKEIEQRIEINNQKKKKFDNKIIDEINAVQILLTTWANQQMQELDPEYKIQEIYKDWYYENGTYPHTDFFKKNTDITLKDFVKGIPEGKEDTHLKSALFEKINDNEPLGDINNLLIFLTGIYKEVINEK
jgi:hypothetical protein